MSIQENTLVFRRSLLHLVVIGSIIHQSISFLSRGHSTPLCPALPCVTLLREALVYFSTLAKKKVPFLVKNVCALAGRFFTRGYREPFRIQLFLRTCEILEFLERQILE